jgi:hypothetical protein
MMLRKLPQSALSNLILFVITVKSVLLPSR